MMMFAMIFVTTAMDRVTANGVAVKNDPCLTRRMPNCAPFEDLRWVAEPAPLRVNGCRFSADLSPTAAAVHRRILPLLNGYRVAPGQANRLRPHIDEIQITVQIRFAGIDNMGDCGNYGFCTVTPFPPPPPPATPVR